MKDDGACLFRAVSDQLYGDQDMHDIVRKQCMDYVVSNLIFWNQNYILFVCKYILYLLLNPTLKMF